MPALSKKQNQKKNELIGTVKLFGSTVKANSKIAAVELKISQEKKQFGMDYIGLVEKGASAEQLKKCLLDTMTKIEGYREEIKKQNGKLEDAVNGNSRNKPAPAKKTAVVAVPTRKGSSSTDRNELRSPQRVARPAATASAIPSHANNRRMRSKSPQRPAASPVTQATKTTGSEPKSSPRVAHPVATASAIPSHSNRGRMRSKSPQRPAASPVTRATKATGSGPHTVPQRATGNETHAPASSPKVNRGRARNPTRRDVETKQTATPVAVKTATPVIARPVVAKPVVARRVVEEDSPYAAAFSAIDDGYESSDHEEEYPDADPSRWRLREVRFNGKAKYWSRGKQVKKEGPIPVAIENFKAKPKKYDAMIYQLDMLDPNSDWDPSQHKFTVIFRKGTVNWVPIGVDPNGKYGLLQHYYEYCKSFPNDVLPPQYRDKYTDNFSFRGQKLHSGPVKPIMPGRGMGLGDSPDPLKLIKEIDPGDIFQGRVGNCWLLSGISALAQYDAAIKRLFRKTKNLDRLPMDEPHFMTITLWDLKTWKEVDVVIDERLCSDPFSKKEGLQLLGTRPSMDGELWVPYLEKALVAHCGGWDKIESGQCTHAWALLTGIRKQYYFRPGPSGKCYCRGKYNYEEKMADIRNAPRDTDQTWHKMPWPEVGGGGSRDLEVSQDELFQRMAEWKKVDYLVGAGTKGESDSNRTGGLVDNHAYAVMKVVMNAAGTGIDLAEVRNPWGRGEIEDGEFGVEGHGWEKYPEIKNLLKPRVANDGIFWVTKKEFFNFFLEVYLCAESMTQYKST